VPKRSDDYLEARRRQILDGARRAFAAHGYDGATVVRLEEEIGLSRGAIHNYFSSKWELFFELARRDFERIADVWLEQGHEGVVRAMAAESSEWIGVYTELARLIRTRPELREQWNTRAPELERRIEARLADQQRAGELRDDVTAEQIAGFLTVVVDGLALHKSFGFDDDVEALLRLVRSALAPPA
jgi:AcrR family transcriptional regulator